MKPFARTLSEVKWLIRLIRRLITEERAFAVAWFMLRNIRPMLAAIRVARTAPPPAHRSPFVYQLR